MGYKIHSYVSPFKEKSIWPNLKVLFFHFFTLHIANIKGENAICVRAQTYTISISSELVYKCSMVQIRWAYSDGNKCFQEV